MARSLSKDVEHAVNTVVEVMIKKLMETQERIRQKETDFIKIHEEAIKEIEQNIVKLYGKQSFSIEGEKGTFDLEKVENENAILVSDEKSISVPLNHLDAAIKPIKNEYIEKFKDKTPQEIDHIINQKIKGRDYFETNIKTEHDRHDLKRWDKTIDKMKEAKEILSSWTVADHKLKNQQELDQVNKVKEINSEVSVKLTNNIDDKDKYNLMPSQIRAQLEVLNYLKSMSRVDILNTLKVAQKQAQELGMPVLEVYKLNLQREIIQNIRIYKERALDVAFETREKNNFLRQELREIETKINRNLGILYQAKLEQKIEPEQFFELKQIMDKQKIEIQVRYQNIDKSEQRINEQLKVDLKKQLPEIQTEQLTLNDSIALAAAAYSMTNEKTIENIKNFSIENKLSETLEAIDKVTKEVEFEIKEITEMTVSR